MRYEPIVGIILFVSIFLAGCTDNGADITEPEEVIEDYFSMIDEGNYRGIADMAYYSNGTPFEIEDDEIEELEDEMGVDGEKISIEIIKMEKVKEWKGYDPDCDFTEFSVTFNITSPEGIEEITEEFTVGHFIDDDIWALIIREDDIEDVVETLNVKASAESTSDSITLELFSGYIEWADYEVRVDGTIFTTMSIQTSAGETAVFTDPDSIKDLVIGEEINIKIIEKAENMVVWDDDLISTYV